MLVKDILRGKTKSIVTVERATPLQQAMVLMVEHNVGCLPVVDDKSRLIGMITDRSIFKKISEVKENYLLHNVGDVMSEELVFGAPDEDLAMIAQKMRSHWVRHVPIVEDERIIGLVSLWDLLKSKAGTETENRYLKHCLDEQFYSSRAGDD